jgi:hypothetical protein
MERGRGDERQRLLLQAVARELVYWLT